MSDYTSASNDSRDKIEDMSLLGYGRFYYIQSQSSSHKISQTKLGSPHVTASLRSSSAPGCRGRIRLEYLTVSIHGHFPVTVPRLRRSIGSIPPLAVFARVFVLIA